MSANAICLLSQQTGNYNHCNQDALAAVQHVRPLYQLERFAARTTTAPDDLKQEHSESRQNAADFSL